MASPSATQDATAYLKTIRRPPPPGTPYALPLPGTERPNRSPVYRHWRFQTGPLLSTLDPAEQTFHQIFEASAARLPNQRCLGWRPWSPATKSFEDRYVWITYAEVAERRKNLGAGIVEILSGLGVTDEKYGVGLWSQNRAEWEITELALVSQSLWPVSLYETLGPEAGEYIINHSALTCVACSLPHIPTLLKLAPRVPSLKLIISLDPLDAGEPTGHSKLALLNAAAAEVGIKICPMDEVEAIGERSGRPMRPPVRDDVLTINYTSGTTGDPKGVLLLHEAGVAAINTARSMGTLEANGVHLSYLPVAHIYGRVADQLALAVGASIGYFHGDITALVEDLKILRPTALISVPRLFNRICSAVQAATADAPGVRGALSRAVIDTKKASMRLPPGKATNRHAVYDRVWTPKVRQAVGLSRVRTMVSGSAQLDPGVQVFLRAAFGNDFLQGFGMTETYSVGLVQMRDDMGVGTIGAPQPGVEVCIESVPEYEYTVHDRPRPRGEMLLRGPVMFKEYYKNAEETAKSVEPDGWFHTGDIVEVDARGCFRIIDRKKNVLKLAQGEYISPERIENVCMASMGGMLAAAYVHGDPSQSCLVAIFGVDPDQLAAFASRVLKTAVRPSDTAAVAAAAADPRVRSAVVKELDAVAKKNKFNSYERVRACVLALNPFTIENELMTPTLKLKRPLIAKAYRKEIDSMYEEINASSPRDRSKL